MSLQLRRYGDLLLTYSRPQWRRLALLAALMGGGIALQLFNPQVVRYFIDTAQAGGSDADLATAAVVFLAAAFAGQAMDLGANYTASSVSWAATNALRSDLTLHCLRLDMPFHKLHTPGELIERIDGDVSTLGDFLSRFAVHVLGNGILVIGILLLLFRENVRVGLGLTLYVAVALLAMARLQNLAVARWAADRQAHAELYGYIEERISATEDIRASGAEGYVLERLDGLLEQNLLKNRTAQLMRNVTSAITGTLYVLGYAIGLGLGAYLYLHGQVTIGGAFLIVYYVGILAQPLEKISGDAQTLQEAGAGIQRMDELFSLKPLAHDHAEAAPLPPGPLSVTFRSVSFSYGDKSITGRAPQADSDGQGDDMVLHDVSFHVPAGHILGILGRTGSGKTTLSRLLFRLYDPSSGEVLLAGKPLTGVALSSLRSRVGLVTQDVQLFHASVRDNLTFFNKSMSDARIQRALTDLRLWDWVRSLPAGLDAVLAGEEKGLSAGEGQLLAMGRIFLRDPGVVVLDEASSRLDPVTETLLEQAMDQLLQDRTGIIIAHRLRTIARADDILIMEEGRVVEYGSRATLAADSGSHFHHLLQTGLEEVLA